MYALQEQLAREHQRALRARAQEARVARRAADYAKAEREVHRARVASERAQRQLRALSA